MSSMMLALTGVLIYFSKFVPIIANDICCRKTFRVILLPLVLSANNNCADKK